MAPLRGHAGDARTYLAGLSFWVEERLLGTIDGLRAGGSAAIEPLLVPAHGRRGSLPAIAAAHALAVDGNEGGIEALFTAVRAAEGPKLSVFTRAIALSRSEVLLGRIERAIPETGPELAACCGRSAASAAIPAPTLLCDPGAPACAPPPHSPGHIPDSRALGQLQRDLEQDLGASDRAVRDAAINTGLILGISAAWNRCLELAAKPAPGVAGAMLLVAMLGNERDQDRVLAAVGNEAMRADALFAAGFAGTRAANRSLPSSDDRGACRQARRRSVCAITGLDLERERLVAAPPDEPAEPIPLEEEDLDADLVPKAEDLLPSPDVPGVVRWWSRQAGRFAAGKRYLGGRLVDLVVLEDALLRGPMRRRYATALELAVAPPDAIRSRPTPSAPNNAAK